MGLFGRAAAVEAAVTEPVFHGPERRRTELFSTVFHGLVNLLVELFALTAAFVFFLSAESTKAVQNQIVAGIDQPQVLGAASSAVQSVLRESCATGTTAGGVALPAGLDCCGPQGAVRAASDSLLSVIDLAAPPVELGGDAATVQNVWVMRVAVLFCALGLLVLFVAYFVTRLARGPRVPLARIVLYNVLLFVFAFGVQVAFMGMVTLRYIPITPSQQLRALRAAVEEEERLANVTDEAAASNVTALSFAGDRAGGRAGEPRSGEAAKRQGGRAGEPSGAASASGPSVDPSAIVPPASGLSAVVLVVMIAAVGLILYLAWRARAFRLVSTAQGLCIQLAFIFAVMVGVYFWLSNSIGAELQENAIRETVGYVAQIVRKAPGDGGAARAVWASVRASLDERGRTAEEQDRRVRLRNEGILREVRVFAAVMGGVFAAVVLLTALARRQAAQWRFWVALLLVGLVGASTTLLVEYGFAQNVLRSYRPVSAPQLARGLAQGFSRSIERHAQWFCEDARCGDPPRALQNECCAEDSTGPFAPPNTFIRWRWARLTEGGEGADVPARDVRARCGDPAVWDLDHLYAASAEWFDDAKALAVGSE